MNISKIMKSYVSLEEQLECVNIYQEQLELFSKDIPIHYKPFTILKVKYKNGTEVLPNSQNYSNGDIVKFSMMSQSDLFKLLSDDDIYIYQMSKECLELVEKYYKNKTMNERMEGIVIRPQFYNNKCAPFLKVRNEQYLTLVYGYDYRCEEKYKRQVERKNIRNKLKLSIIEFELGLKMLSHNLENLDTEEYRQTVANMLFENKKEEKLDPRL